ncbi:MULTISPECIES: PQQ-dependent dehydrogenase, methanol/ethanol family [Prauserella salsuginis group]|uniref:Alcohol dehydrogenase (Cytochrome c) n=2 Tax=Prauserella salsuginis group TaxID=2893672 RepID=A0A839XVS0_9PSEU|nr:MULTISPECIES: PQQ-dependent dehydrogenase, methanol/ethanol family [Prauserella salsuginis group]MBB3663895.1 alcohol dehydrogenase (cytochrome c) [Prauserella sediminis]MCR3718059.1 alcohol dehydrogenase (cytochrome c) [Prauserella flava]MCR3732608.1 alcohol dehydrogenase (cytochrome c) [Prauserella salsuginis]
MTIEYVDAGEAINHSQLSSMPHVAPDVTRGVNYDRILQARSESHNWITYYGDYDGKRHSLLDQINVENVKDLKVAWIHQSSATGMMASTSTYAFEACPLVVDGVMFVTGWDGLLWALDAVTGEQLWRYKHAVPFDVTLCCANVNRGCAVANGKVYMVTQNAQLLALDATTGEKVWQKTIGDVRAGESASLAPLVVKDTLITGSAGGEFGVRGHIDCWDLETGEQRWRTYTVPKPGEPGSETWPAEGEAWQRGGANHWVTGTFDPELNLYYAGTGNPAPDFDGEVRPGDNLYSDSVVALDVDTGEIKWHYQFTPHDLWDYDSTMEMTLFERDGKKLLAHFDKNGYMFVLDRTNGELQHVTPFVDRIDWGAITRDGKFMPRKYPDKEGEPCHFFPGPAGAKEWTHASYNPEHDLFYVPVADVGATATRRRREFKEGMPYWGAAVEVDVDNMAGSVSAFDSHGEEKWRYRLNVPMAASTLSTAGNLVFAGTPTGEFVALHAETGEELWKFQCGSGHHSSPSTYTVDGKQYITVPVGWGGWLEGIVPGMSGQGKGASLITFSL